jgi:hypothetical protein
MRTNKAMIKAFFYAWGGLPWRKPLAMTAAIITIIMIFGAWVLQKDIPDNASTALIWFDGVIFSWAYGTSAFEAVRESNKTVKKESQYYGGRGVNNDETNIDNH